MNGGGVNGGGAAAPDRARPGSGPGAAPPFPCPGAAFRGTAGAVLAHPARRGPGIGGTTGTGVTGGLTRRGFPLDFE